MYCYDKKETDFPVNGFRYRFEIGYRGERNLRRTAPNLKLDKGGNRSHFMENLDERSKGRKICGSI